MPANRRRILLFPEQAQAEFEQIMASGELDFLADDEFILLPRAYHGEPDHARMCRALEKHGVPPGYRIIDAEFRYAHYLMPRLGYYVSRIRFGRTDDC